MKPHRLTMTHQLVLGYDLQQHMDVFVSTIACGAAHMNALAAEAAAAAAAANAAGTLSTCYVQAATAAAACCWQCHRCNCSATEGVGLACQISSCIIRVAVTAAAWRYHCVLVCCFVHCKRTAGLQQLRANMRVL
jgi:hypothetical protein